MGAVALDERILHHLRVIRFAEQTSTVTGIFMPGDSVLKLSLGLLRYFEDPCS